MRIAKCLFVIVLLILVTLIPSITEACPAAIVQQQAACYVQPQAVIAAPVVQQVYAAPIAAQVQAYAAPAAIVQKQVVRQKVVRQRIVQRLRAPVIQRQKVVVQQQIQAY